MQSSDSHEDSIVCLFMLVNSSMTFAAQLRVKVTFQKVLINRIILFSLFHKWRWLPLLSSNSMTILIFTTEVISLNNKFT